MSIFTAIKDSSTIKDGLAKNLDLPPDSTQATTPHSNGTVEAADGADPTFVRQEIATR